MKIAFKAQITKDEGIQSFTQDDGSEIKYRKIGLRNNELDDTSNISVNIQKFKEPFQLGKWVSGQLEIDRNGKAKLLELNYIEE